LPSGKSLLLLHANLGSIQDWGTPIDVQDGYANYAELPWRLDGVTFNSPCLILIDGRYRVTCFLSALQFAPLGSTIIFDDYYDRPEYFVIESIATPQMKIGRAAIFEVAYRVENHVLASQIQENRFNSA
jgi:hypothetical protein